jgi:8-oxo-dGTP pyrophosphatase MutT (NUDIX family)
MYKVHFENRFIIISPEPDRLQKYGLFHKFHDTNELYKIISAFQSDKELSSINIYGPDITFIWKIFRIYFTEVEAAGGLIRHSSGKYLFIEKNKKWDLPKGHIEPGESPESCALREVKEECGLSNHKIIKSLPPSYHTYMWEGISYLKKTHWFLMSDDEEIILKPQTDEGITQVEWLGPEEISKIKSTAWLSLTDLINSTVINY